MADWRLGQHDEFRVRREVCWPIGFPLPRVDENAAPAIAEPLVPKQGLLVFDRPETDLVALMQTAPGDTPQESVESQQELREVLADAIDQLEPRERWVFLGNASEGLGLRTIATQLSLSKTQVHRILQAARNHLADALVDHPLVAARLRQEIDDGAQAVERDQAQEGSDDDDD